ncbi:MAG: hypothetical protein SOV27_00720 [Eubacteriales bacterium]|nr:hypothetical protein [Eubacteriales bacterium]
MKKTILNISKIIPAIFALISGILLFSANTKTFADEVSSLPSYFSVYTANYSGDEAVKYSKREITDVFSNGDAIFLKKDQAVILEFQKDKLLMADGKTLRITQDIGYTVTVNDKLLSTTLKPENGFDFITGENEVFKLAINPNIALASEFSYGKYSLTFSYWYYDDIDTKAVSFTCNFYVFNYDNFCGTINKNYSLNNKINGAYCYNYNGSTVDGNLFSLTYDYTHFNVRIIKTYQQLSYVTQINYSNGNLNIINTNEREETTTTNYVAVNQIANTTSAKVTFNDIGTYYVYYETINPYGNLEVFSEYYEYTNSAVAPNSSDTINIFGYQSFFTTQNGLKEFKQVNENDASEVTYQADITTLLNSEKSDNENFNTVKDRFLGENSIQIVSTNQAPIYFTTNASIDKEKTLYYYFSSADKLTTLPTNTYSQLTKDAYVYKNYACTPLSTAGYYFVKLAYTYEKYSAKTLYQYFLFQITNNSPKLNINELITRINETTHQEETIEQAIPTDYITCNDIKIEKEQSGMFDSISQLKVYKSTNFNSSELNTNAYDQIVETSAILSESAKYKIELTYGNKDQKNYVTYFTIDKTGIQNVTLSTLTNYSGTLYTKTGTVNSFFTNQPVAISWANKEANGRAQTYAEYKFFPTNYSASFASTLTSDVLKNYYRSPYTTYGIPSTDTFSYASGNLPSATYSNTSGYSTLSESSILSQSGLYIVKIYDQTANNKEIIGTNVIYKAFFIDKTKTNIIAESDGEWAFTGDAKITSSDYTLYFGSHKIIQFEKLLLNDTNHDEWLQKIILNDAEFLQNYTETYKDKLYLKINTNNTIYYSKSENGTLVPYTYTLSVSENYSKTEKAMNGTTPNESQYIFYVSSASNSQVTNSYDSYVKYYNNCHMVTFSTDNSKMKLSYRNAEGNKWNLQQFNVVSADEDTKYNYFQPTNVNTLANSGEILDFSYCTEPSALLSVKSIKMDYYAFSESDYGTYVFKKAPTSSLYIYQKDSVTLGSAILGEANSYMWQLNVENYNITTSQTAQRTRAGKYVITRTYENALDANDPKTRILIFIVDRNGIISAPSINSNGDSIYYTGAGIKLQVLNNYQTVKDSTLFFYDIYFANQMSSETSGIANPVLTTNLLPVTVYVPAFKYGYDVFATNTYNFVYKQKNGLTNNFNTDEDSIVEYYDYKDKTYKAYDAYKLYAYVEYRQTNVLTTPYLERYELNKALSNNYLTTASSEGIMSFNKEGYYHVVIYSTGGDQFSYDFRIEYKEPEYTVLDNKNNPLNSYNGIYYTNKPIVRIAWENSSNKFLANINSNEISYRVSSGITGKIDPSRIMSNGDNGYYVDINLSELSGAFVNDAQTNITLQFNGNKEDYSNLAYFSKTTTIKVDLEAPIKNVSSLVNLTGLKFVDLREYYSASNEDNSNRYNMSKSTGLFANYAYILDISNFADTLKTPEASTYDFYKAYYRIFEQDGINTKYVLGNMQESEIYLDNYNDTSENILFKTKETYESLFKANVGKYIEIIEEDYAGNRTVYTVYITDLKDSSDIAVEYKSLTSTTGDTSKNVSFKNLTNTLNIYSKYSLNLEKLNLLNNEIYLNGRYYQTISVNNVMYVKTPFSGNRFYKVSEFTTTEDSPLYSLQEITTLSSSASSQPIVLYSVPMLGSVTINAFVLNKVLEYYTLAQYEGDQLLEGILIRMPSSSADENKIYAVNLVVSGVISGSVISPFVISDEKYFTEEQPQYSSQNYKISYVTGVNGEKYFCFQIIRNISKNDYFIYEVTDNFGEKTKITHIFGQIEIKDPITSESEIITSYKDNGAYVYYASESIIYKYDTTIYAQNDLTVSHDGINKVFRITKNGSRVKVEIRENDVYTETFDYVNYFACSIINGAIMKLELKGALIDISKNNLGNNYEYLVQLTLNKDFSTGEGNDQDSKYFCIYNKVPKISLLGANGDDVTSILGNKGVYTNNITINYEQTVLDFAYEMYLIVPDGTVIRLTDEYTAKENGTYRIVVSYLGDLKGISKSLYFTIKNTSDYKFSVMKINSDGSYSEVKATGRSFSYKVKTGSTNATKTEQIHYIVNGNYTILVNESLSLICETTYVVDDYSTIYTIHTDYDNLSLVEFYSYRIAVTKIPVTYSLFKENDFVEYDSTGNSIDLTKSTSTISSIYTKDGYDIGRKIAWKAWYLIPENLVSATIYFGEIGKTVYTPVVTQNDEYFTTTLKASGVYYFKFTDIAGNSHFFGAYSDIEYFAIKYLSSVIFEINDENPINYAIYDKQVKVSIPENTLDYYDTNAKPSINIELNGEPYEIKATSKYVWDFTEQGLYKIWFSAKIDGESIYEAPLYFTILSSNETRTVFNFSSYGDYYIEDILLNNVSINSRLANANNGTLYNNKYLKELSLHINDLKTGEGVWTFVINANNEFNQKYTFSVWINNPTIPITISHPSGTVTTDDITITFLSSNIITEAGDCILKITGNQDVYITKEALANGSLSELNEIKLTEAREYYIEITTLSGQLLYSAYINKTEPLNAVSIIVITVSSIVIVAGIVVFMLLRKKMKVK